MVTLLLTAGELPDSTRVRKPTGGKPYTLRTDIKLYGEGAKVVKTDPTVRFLVSEDGGINIINQNTSLAVDFELDEAIEFLQRIQDERESS